MIRTIRLLLFSLLSAILASVVHAQVPTSTPPFGSFGGGPDVIDLANLNSHFVIPVLHKTGRGTNFTYDLSYDNSVWYPVTSGSTTTWQPVTNWGWRALTEVAVGYISYQQSLFQPPGCPQMETIYSGFAYHDQFGITHPFGLFMISNHGCWKPTSGSQVAADGSGFTLSASDLNEPLTASLVSKTGQIINAPLQVGTGSATATDRNGNQITVDSAGHFYDTLGSTVLTASGNATQSSPVVLTYTPPNTTSSKCTTTNTSGVACYTINYTNYTVATNFGNSTIGEYKSSGAVPLVTSIVLPDGSSYIFTYEATPSSPQSGACSGCVTGRIASIQYPTQGTISYVYYNSNSDFTTCTTGNNGVFSDGSASCLLRTTPDGTWTYTRTQGTGAASTTTVVAPKMSYDSAANETVIQFQGIYETQRVTNKGTSTALLTTNTCYNGATSPCTGTAITAAITSRTVSSTLAGTSNFTDQHAMTYDSYGNLLTQTDYDYGSGAPGTLLGKTTITYASLPPNITAFSQTITKTNYAGSTVSQTQYNYDQSAVQTTSNTPQHVSVTGSRGNLTSVYSYYSGSSYLTQSATYFDTGNVQTATDVNNAQTTYAYGDCGNSFPTLVTEPLGMSRTYAWDTNCTGGVITSVKDENSNTTTTAYSDPYYWRPASITYPDGGVTSFTYTSPTAISIGQKMNASQTMTSTILMDGLGRTQETKNSDSPNPDIVATTYDPLGRVYTISNPYRTTSDPTYGLTTYHYDALSRPTLIIPPDGTATTNNVAASYTNNCVTATDQASKQRTGCANSLGYLTQVFENPTGLNYETDYKVDPLGNTTIVTQKGGSSNSSYYRTRYYSFDLLSRLTQSIDPEAGTVSYSYDGNGNLVSKQSPAQNQTGSQTVTISYCYDAFHRMTAKAYTYSPNTPPTCTGTPPTFPSPAATYGYDQSTVWGPITNPKGRLTSTCAGTAACAEYSYDTMGRPLLYAQCDPSNCGSSSYNTSYTYDLAGNMLTSTNEVGVTFTYTYDSVGRPTQMTSSLVDSNHPATLASNISYGPQSAPVQTLYGNSLTGAAAYNNRLQPCHLNLASSSTGLANCSSTAPTGTVLDLTLGYNLNTSNNGNVATFSATGQQTFSRSYGYDALNRLGTYSDSASSQVCKGLSWGYDGWGNLLSQQTTAGSCFQLSASVGTNNQLSGPPYTYDAAGNMTYDGTNHYFYDAENRLIQVNGTLGTCSTATACYVYDASGQRVRTTESSGSSEWVRDIQGHVISQEAVGSGYNRGYIYLGSQQIAEYGSGTTYFVQPDHLGSTRLMTELNQSVCGSMDYMPFGQPLVLTDSCSTMTQFTGDEWDPETGLDHTLFRKYSWPTNRWTTPDPAGLAAVDPTKPQSWNQYAYVLNNPVSLVDPSGLDDCDPDDPFGCCDLICVGGGPIGGPPIGIGGGGSPGPPAPTPIPEAPINVGVPDDTTMGPGPIWTEQIPISVGPLSPYLIIQNLTTTANGTVIGSFPGEQLCINGVCLAIYWDPALHAWTGKSPVKTPRTQANEAFVKTWLIAQGVGTVGGCVIGAGVATGLVIANPETWPLAGESPTYGCAAGALIGFFEALPYSTLAAGVDYLWTYSHPQ